MNTKKLYLCMVLVILSIVILMTASAESKNTWIQTKTNCYYISFRDNKGTDSTLFMGKHDHEFGKSIIQFELSGIPKGAQITSAILTLFCEETFVNNPETEVLTYKRICEPWDKSKVSLNALPQTSKTDMIKAVWPSPGKSYRIDITSFVRGWHQGTFANYGILGDADIKTDSYAVFTSSNLYPKIIPSHKEKLGQVPKLTVVYQTK